MKYVQCCGVILSLNLAAAETVCAGGLRERVKNWLLPPEARAATIEHDRPELDRVASGCVACHNGVRATHIVVKSAEAPLQFSISGAQGNHPVGMPYDYYATTRAREYVPRFSLHSNITLVDGKVTCISCHRLRQAGASAEFFEVRVSHAASSAAEPESCTASGELTIGPQDGGLCLACHRM